MHLVSTIGFSLEFLTLLGRRFFVDALGDLFGKGLLGFQFHTCKLYCRLWGFGGYWLTCGFGGIRKLWFFWGLRLSQCLGHPQHTLASKIFHPHCLVHPLFHSFWGGVGGNVCLHDDQKTTEYCLTEYSFIVQLSYIAHLPQNSSIVQFCEFIHRPTSTYSSIFQELKMVFEEVDIEKMFFH